MERDSNNTLEILIHAKLIMLLESIVKHRDNILSENGTDEELHNFRVAFRRLKSILKSFDFAFDKKFARFQISFIDYIFSTTNEIRDNDVFLKNLQKYHKGTTKKEKKVLRRLDHMLSTKKEEEYEYLRYFLSSSILTSYIDMLRSAINDKDIFRTKAQIDLKTAREKLFSTKIEKFLEDARSVKLSSKAKIFHKLRIKSKSLRYVGQFLGFADDDKINDKFMKRIKKIQTILGEHQDIFVEQKEVKELFKKGKITVKVMKKMRKEMQKEVIKKRKQFKKELDKLDAVYGSVYGR